MWLIASGREDLREKVGNLSNYRLCSIHFENRMYLNDLRTRLLPTAMPTIFPSLASGSSSTSSSCLRPELFDQYAHDYGLQSVRVHKSKFNSSLHPMKIETIWSLLNV